VIELEGGFSNPPLMADKNVRPPFKTSMKIEETNKKREEAFPLASSFLNPYAPIRQHRHRLPHWQQGSVYYFVTWRLADSLPREKLARWREGRELWLDKNPPPWDSRTQMEYDEKFSQTIDDWLDAGEGSCILTDPTFARCIADALLHSNDERYALDCFIVMPNHVHVLFRLIEPYRLETVVKSWKGFTAREINRHLQRHGSLWQEDYWDRMIRDESHFLKCRDYIHENPSKAHLAANKFVLFVRELEGGFSNPPLMADKNVRPPK
jgi:REP element-mobilizing transposase RayT